MQNMRQIIIKISALNILKLLFVIYKFKRTIIITTLNKNNNLCAKKFKKFLQYRWRDYYWLKVLGLMHWFTNPPLSDLCNRGRWFRISTSFAPQGSSFGDISISSKKSDNQNSYATACIYFAIAFQMQLHEFYVNCK